jgi:hypothetical protein
MLRLQPRLCVLIQALERSTPSELQPRPYNSNSAELRPRPFELPSELLEFRPLVASVAAKNGATTTVITIIMTDRKAR